MARMPFPPGFFFHPTDAELIMYYLKRKVVGKKLVFDVITELDVYKFAPWDLPDKCLLKTKDLAWYFFCPRVKKYANAARSNRATENGYWKVTGTDKLVTINQRTVGMRKTLIFYKGHPSKGEQTDWVMHEYRLEDKILIDVVQDAYVLCKIFQKGGLGPKNGAQYGALFNEKEWVDMDGMHVESPPVTHQISSRNVRPGDINNIDAASLSVPRPRDLSVNFVPELDPSRCLRQNTAMQPSIKDICVESSAVDPHILPDYVPPGPIGSSAAICVTAPENSFSWPKFKSDPSTDGPLSMDIAPDMDIHSLLNMFTEDTSMPPVKNNSHEFDIHGHLPLLDENAISNDLGVLNNWIELNDLSTPLEFPSEAVELDWLQTGSIYAAHTHDMSIGMDEFHSGVGSLCPKVPRFCEFSALLGPHLLGNNLKELEKGNCIGNFKAHGFDAVRSSVLHSATTEPEKRSSAEENPKRESVLRLP